MQLEQNVALIFGSVRVGAGEVREVGEVGEGQGFHEEHKRWNITRHEKSRS